MNENNTPEIDSLTQSHKKKDPYPVIRKNIFIKNSKYFSIMIYCLLFFILSILIYKVIGNLDVTAHVISRTFDILSPFIVGAFIAFIIYPLVHFFYRSLCKNTLHIKSDKACKWLSILFSYIIAIGLLVILLVVVIPQVCKSIMEIAEQIPIWYKSAVSYVTSLQEKTANGDSSETVMKITSAIDGYIPQITGYLTNTASNIIPVIFSTSMAIIKGIISFIISIMVSIYMISDHKILFYQIKRLLYAFMPKKTADTIRMVCKESGNIFISFIFGKAIDSLIIGIICFISMLVFRFPYAILISVIVGITNMIPYFGPYMGGIIGFIFILINNPIKALLFFVLILVIQQFDGLYLGPKILGEKTGLSPLWVIFSITVGGSLFGVIGMFLGVPCVAVLSYILDLIIKHFLRKKHMKVTPYDSPDSM